MDPYQTTGLLDRQPSILVRLVHSVPHVNITMQRVNSTFDPRSVIYKEVSEFDTPSISLAPIVAYRRKFPVSFTSVLKFLIQINSWQRVFVLSPFVELRYFNHSCIKYQPLHRRRLAWGRQCAQTSPAKHKKYAKQAIQRSPRSLNGNRKKPIQEQAAEWSNNIYVRAREVSFRVSVRRIHKTLADSCIQLNAQKESYFLRDAVTGGVVAVAWTVHKKPEYAAHMHEYERTLPPYPSEVSNIRTHTESHRHEPIKMAHKS